IHRCRRYIITKRFRLKVPTMDSPVVLAVPTGWSRNELERTAQIFFEQFNVPGIYIAEKPLLAAYGCGVLTGLVIDIGHNFTDITPILDSTVQGHALQRLALAGAHVEERLLEVLRQDSGATSTLGDKLDLSFCRYVKERHFDLTRLNAKGELATNDTKPIELTYQDIKVSLNPRILQTIEVLFSPGLTNQYSLDLLAAIERAILLCDFDKRTALWDSFILTGGLSMMKGFQAHLELRLKSILPCSDNFGDSQVQEVKFIKIPDYFSKFKDRPDYMAYLGATIAAKLVFVDPKNYVNKVDYNETGPAAISSKGV
ncbi:actin family, partial [Dimargaris cristalligena]